MSEERFLVDKSALARWNKPAVSAVLDGLSERGLLCVCAAVEMEVVHSVRRVADLGPVVQSLRGFDLLPSPDEVWDRAKRVQLLAVRGGNHRALSMADLLIAATAERHDVTVLHYDGDYDMIAAITGQPCRWVVDRGTADT